MQNYSIFSLILISIISILLSPSTCLLSQLRVTLNDTTINSISTHTWTLTYTNNISRAQFVLNFPPCVYVQSNTFVTFLGTSGHTINNLVASSNSLNFTLSVPTSSLIYVIAVNNVKNCFRASSSRSFTVYSKEDGST